MATLEATTLDGTDATILTALAPTPHVYQPLPVLHARSGVPAGGCAASSRPGTSTGFAPKRRIWKTRWTRRPTTA